MTREILSGLVCACIVFLFATCAGCRAAVNLQVRTFECSQVARDASGAVTLTGCSETGSVEAGAVDLSGDDPVDVDTSGEDTGGAALRAVLSPVLAVVGPPGARAAGDAALASRDHRRCPRRKRGRYRAPRSKASSAKRVRVRGYTVHAYHRSAPRRRRRK